MHRTYGNDSQMITPTNPNTLTGYSDKNTSIQTCTATPMAISTHAIRLAVNHRLRSAHRHCR